MDYRHDFEADWTPVAPDSLPLPGTRCIVSDGDIVVLATFTKSDDHALWIFQGLTECANENFKVLEWMTCPRPKVKRNEKPVGENKKSTD